MFSSISAVEPFKEEYITRSVLKKLIDHQGAVERKSMNPDNEDELYLYKKGTSTDYFICIIQGQVEVVVGNECLVFVDGPFTVFGMQALFAEKGHAFLPDYDVKMLSDLQYLKISRALYRSAIRASQLEKSERTPSHMEELDEIFWNNSSNKAKESTVTFEIKTDETGLLLIPNTEHKPRTSEDKNEVNMVSPV